jgi:hypothetical protein
MDTAVTLKPVRNLWLRLVAAALLAGFIFLSSAAWYKEAMMCGWVVLWLGSYPQARLIAEHFERTGFIGFVPVRTKRWPIDRFTHIETDTADDSTGGWLWMFSMHSWLVWRLCDLAFPWVGGGYKIWLRAASGRRVLAWQGNNAESFRSNLEALQVRSGLPVGRG